MIVDNEEVLFRSGRGGGGSSASMNISPRKVVGAGGDGGRGGSAILQISPHLYDLNKFRGNKKFIAKNGENGYSSNKKGRDADDLTVGLPSGTRVLESGRLIVDLIDETESFLLCRGGRGGKGSYKRNYTTPPGESQTRQVVLDYRIPNEVALVGFPNCGKSSLFNVLCKKEQKVAEYPYTTKSCFWARAESGFKIFTVLDTPPLKRRKNSQQYIEPNFLKHLFRSRIVLFLSDDSSQCREDFESLQTEISLYNPSLLDGKKVFHLLTKSDKIDISGDLKDIILCSVKDDSGIENLKKLLLDFLAL